MKIFVISLAGAVKRQTFMREQMNRLGLDFEFVEAIDGRKMDVKQLDELVDQKWAWRYCGWHLSPAEIVRSLDNYGSSRQYVFPYQGRNSRLDEIQAAILRVKLHHLDNDVAIRQDVARKYYAGIKNPLVTLPA